MKRDAVGYGRALKEPTEREVIARALDEHDREQEAEAKAMEAIATEFENTFHSSFFFDDELWFDPDLAEMSSELPDRNIRVEPIEDFGDYSEDDYLDEEW
jgi:hypothetical protein